MNQRTVLEQGPVRALIRRHRWFLAVLPVAFPVTAFAQTVTPPEIEQAGRQGEQLLRQQQQVDQARQREADRVRQQPSPLPAQTEGPKTETVPGADGGCITVKRLELVGADRLPRSERRAVERQAVGRCLGLSDINDLLKMITESYIRRGLVTTRAYIPQQNSQDGVLQIVVIEGTVESLSVEPKGSANAGNAFPPMIGRVFNLRRAEQGIDQLNRLGSNNAKIDIRPGSAPGNSAIVVVNQPSRRVTGGAAIDNSGSPETGLWQGGVSLVLDNSLGLNDQFSGSFRRNVEHLEGGAKSSALSASYALPFGWWAATFSYSQSSYGSVVKGITRDFLTTGESDGASLRLDRVIYRDNRAKMTLYGTVNRRSTRNFITEQRIDSSSRVTTTAELNSNLSVIAGPALASFDLGVTKGLDWFGALTDPTTLLPGAPRAQFTKVNFGTGISGRLKLAGITAQLSSQLTGQWSDDVLFASEQIAIAGAYAVRGYRDVRLFGDSGLLVRNEIGLPFSFPIFKTGKRGFAKPFAGYDVGRTFDHFGTPGAALSGWSAGLNLGLPRVSIQLSWSGAGARSSRIPADHQFFTRVSIAL